MNSKMTNKNLNPNDQNWHTDTVELYFNNDKTMYDHKVRLYKKYTKLGGFKASNVRVIASCYTQYVKSLDREYRALQVNWEYIAWSFNDDMKEHNAYENEKVNMTKVIAHK